MAYRCFEPHFESEAKCKVFIMKFNFHSYTKNSPLKGHVVIGNEKHNMSKPTFELE